MFRQFIRSRDGAALAYIALILVVMVGMIGLAFDLGRVFVLRTELQKAADAAAVAGAYQLDPSETDQSTIVTRVDAALDASSNAAVTANRTQIDDTPGDIVIADRRLLNSIPADDDTAIDNTHEGAPYNYVEVTTELRATNLTFLRVFGSSNGPNMRATAVAGRGRAVCGIAPMMMCNPAEDPVNGGGGFDPADYVGQQVLAVTRGNTGTWVPGNFGFMQVSDPGANAVREALSAPGGANQCYDAFGDQTTQPGRLTQQSRRGINSRFGEDDSYPSAQNIQTYPRDAVFNSATRIGDGDWDPEQYWADTHGTSVLPIGLTTSSTRFEVYRHEIDNTLIPNPDGVPPTGISVYSPSGLNDDRRVITMAVANCVADQLKGKISFTSVAFLNAFITEPILETPDDDFYFEIIGGSIAGSGGLVPVPARDFVEVIR